MIHICSRAHATSLISNMRSFFYNVLNSYDSWQRFGWTVRTPVRCVSGTSHRATRRMPGTSMCTVHTKTARLVVPPAPGPVPYGFPDGRRAHVRSRSRRPPVEQTAHCGRARRRLESTLARPDQFQKPGLALQTDPAPGPGRAREPRRPRAPIENAGFCFSGGPAPQSRLTSPAPPPTSDRTPARSSSSSHRARAPRKRRSSA